MSRLFISHSSDNNAEAFALLDWLRDNGWDDVFLDRDASRGIAAGKRWEQALHKAARRCEAVIFLISRAWLDSSWCLQELNLAHKLNKRLFGVVIEESAKDDVPDLIKAEYQVVSLASGRDHIPFDVTIPVTGDLKQVYFSEEGLKRLKAGLTEAGLDPRFFAWPPADEPNRAPYRGLKPLEAEDAGIFFAREAEIIEALDRLRGLNESSPPRLLVILGASGAGKSSFMRAGLWPRLKRDDRNFLPLPVIRPERAALSGDTGLERSLEDAFKAARIARSRAEIRNAVDAGAELFVPLLAGLVNKGTPPALEDTPSKAPTLVFAVDQGEELFLAEGAEEANKFLALLRSALTSAETSCLAIITIRSDAYERLQTAASLEAVPQQTLSLPPIAKGAYLDVIEGPARLLAGTRALKIEPALSKALLADIEEGTAKDALPLLAFTLGWLYSDHGGKGSLTLPDYEALGRVKGSIEAAVERALKACEANRNVPQDRAAKLALLRTGLIPYLASIDPDTGSPQRRVAKVSELPSQARPLIDALVDARLLSVDKNQAGENTIEPSHEALLRQWGLLKGWLDEDSEMLSTLEGTKRASRDWVKKAKGADWLLHVGARLEVAQRLVARPDLERHLDNDDRAYLRACRKAEEEKRLNIRKFEETRLKLLEETAQKETNARVHQERLRQQEQEAREVAEKLSSKLRVRLAAAILFLAAAAFAALWAIVEKDSAQEQRIVAESEKRQAEFSRDQVLRTQSRHFTDLAEQAAASNDYATAILLALEALPASSEDSRPYFAKAETTLYQAHIENRELSIRQCKERPKSRPDCIIEVFGGSLLAESSEGRRDQNLAVSQDGKKAVKALYDHSALVSNRSSGTELLVLRGHTDLVLGAAFSPNAEMIVTASRDKTARIWRTGDGVLLAVLKGHDAQVGSAVFSPDGTRVVTTSNDNTARLWDAKTGEPVAVLRGHEGGVATASFSADGSQIATASQDKSVRLWDGKTGELRTAFKGHDAGVNSAMFSPDGNRIVSASQDGTARLWDVRTKSAQAVLRAYETKIAKAFFDPSGHYLITFSADGSLRLWNADLPLKRVLLERSEAAVASATLSPAGDFVITAAGNNVMCSDHSAHVWDIGTGALIRSLNGHTDIVKSVGISPGGSIAATGSQDQSAILWDLKTGSKIVRLAGEDGFVESVSFSPDGAKLVTASGNKARMWDTKTGGLITVLGGHKTAVASASFSPDGTRALTVAFDNTARLWDAASGRQIAELAGHTEPLTGAVFSPDGSRIVTSSKDKTARVWDGQTGAAIYVLEGHEKEVNAAIFSPQGTAILTASQDKTARLWDVKTGKQITLLKGHSGGISSVSFSPNGSRVATASADDKTARLWDLTNGAVVAEFAGFQSGVNVASITSDGKYLVTASGDVIGQNDKSAQVWRIFSSTKDLIEEAKRAVPRCLTPAQRKAAGVELEPPAWCITGAGLEAGTDAAKWQPKYPYESRGWKEWLIAKRSGKTLALPEN